MTNMSSLSSLVFMADAEALLARLEALQQTTRQRTVKPRGNSAAQTRGEKIRKNCPQGQAARCEILDCSIVWSMPVGESDLVRGRMVLEKSRGGAVSGNALSLGPASGAFAQHVQAFSYAC